MLVIFPAYYSYKPSSRRGYNLGQDVTPLYPFGFGLSHQISIFKFASGEVLYYGQRER